MLALRIEDPPAHREGVRTLTLVETAAVAGGPGNTGYNSTFAAGVAASGASASDGFNLGYTDPASTQQPGDTVVFHYNNGTADSQTGDYVVWTNITQNSWGYFDLSAYPDNNS